MCQSRELWWTHADTVRGVRPLKCVYLYILRENCCANANGGESRSERAPQRELLSVMDVNERVVAEVRSEATKS